MAERKPARHLVQIGLGPMDYDFLTRKAELQGTTLPDILRQCAVLARRVESVLGSVEAGRVDGNTPIRDLLPLIAIEPAPQLLTPQKPPRAS